MRMKTKHKRAYKYRLYPTEEQKRVLARTFGCARFVYNWALRPRPLGATHRTEATARLRLAG
jgi:transposase